MVSLYIKCMNLFYRREMPDASDNLALIGLAGYFPKGVLFSGLGNLAPKNTFSRTFTQAIVIIALEGCSTPYFVLIRMMIFVYTSYLYSVVMQSNALRYIWHYLSLIVSFSVRLYWFSNTSIWLHIYPSTLTVTEWNYCEHQNSFTVYDELPTYDSLIHSDVDPLATKCNLFWQGVLIDCIVLKTEELATKIWTLNCEDLIMIPA